MILLPRWAWPYLLDKKCPICGHATSLASVEGIGIRQKVDQGRKIHKGNAVLTFEYHCSECTTKTNWISDPDDSSVSAEDLAINILETIEQFMGKKPRHNRNKVSLSKISNKEFNSFKKKLDKFDSHEDFLAFIGIPLEQIENLKKDEKKNGDKSK